MDDDEDGTGDATGPYSRTMSPLALQSRLFL